MRFYLAIKGNFNCCHTLGVIVYKETAKTIVVEFVSKTGLEYSHHMYESICEYMFVDTTHSSNVHYIYNNYTTIIIRQIKTAPDRHYKLFYVIMMSLNFNR